MLQKFNRHENLMAHDENEACVEGDVVRIEPEFVTSRCKNHIVAEIISAVRTGQLRKHVETPEEWRARKGAKRDMKERRRAELQESKLEAIQQELR